VQREAIRQLGDQRAGQATQRMSAELALRGGEEAAADVAR